MGVLGLWRPTTFFTVLSSHEMREAELSRCPWGYPSALEAVCLWQLAMVPAYLSQLATALAYPSQLESWMACWSHAGWVWPQEWPLEPASASKG
jgi:hypothetical protein